MHPVRDAKKMTRKKKSTHVDLDVLDRRHLQRAPVTPTHTVPVVEAVREKEAEEGSDLFVCPKCRARRSTYIQVQIRSADEGMTCFVRCLSCDHRWSA